VPDRNDASSSGSRPRRRPLGPSRDEPHPSDPINSEPQEAESQGAEPQRSEPKDLSLTDAVDAPDAVRVRLEWFARWSDDVVRIPGTKVRIGLDPLVGLIPGVGDAASWIVSAYVPLEAWRQGAPKRMIGRMIATIAADALVGAVPLLGDLFDVTYRANRRNVETLLEWMDASGDAGGGTRERRKG